MLKKDKGKNIENTSYRDTIVRLNKLVSLDKNYFTVLFFVVLISSILSLFIPFINGRIIDSLDFNKWNKFKILLIILSSIYILDMFLKVVQEFLVIKVSQFTVYKLRELSFNKLQRLDLMFFENWNQGELMSRITNDIEDISSSISSSLVELLSSLINLIGSLFFMFYLSRFMTIVSMLTLPVTYFLTKIITGKSKKIFKERQKLLGEVNSQIKEDISGLEVIKSFNSQDETIESFRLKNNKLRSLAIRAQILSGSLMPLMNVIKNLNFTIIAIAGGYLAFKGWISLGVITSFISYSRQFSRPLNEIANSFNNLQSGFSGAERIFEILDQKEERTNDNTAVSAKNIKGKVEFKDVSFSYNGKDPVLKNISFIIPEGTTVAIVGPTGAGKTTIINLLTGFYESYQGKILIDDRDVLSYRKEELREIFGAVLQDTHLFSDTIYENIKYGNLRASREDIKKAAEAAGAHEFIVNLKHGYDTKLEEAGKNLSQGQRQLLALARAIIKDPDILILDEATSSIDTRTELKVQSSMLKLMKDRTSFIIAHRLSTIRNADIILFIKDGSLVESGRHDELLENRSYYYNLYINQLFNKTS